MLDSILPPSIPRRPKKQMQASSTNDLENHDGLDTELETEQIANSESLKYENLSDKTPVIPRRPDRSNSSSKSPSLPVVPKRPQRFTTPDLKESNSLDSSVVNDETERKQGICETQTMSEEHSDDSIDLPKSSEVNSETKDLSELDHSDGNEIPDDTTTKTIKESLALSDDNSIRSIDDDLKPVLQDQDDNDLQDLVHDTTHVDSSGENDKECNLMETADIDMNTDRLHESEDKKNNRLSSESNDVKYNEGKDQSITNEESETPVGVNQETSQTPKFLNEKISDDEHSSHIPHIPRRPKKSKTFSTDTNSKLVEGEASENSNSIDQKQILTERSSEEAKSDFPITEDFQKSETPDLEAINTKPKAPPKPKKLSSKIAAFQQMFNQENPFPKNSDSIKGSSKTDVKVKTTDNKDAPSRLSTDKMKFAQSLQGMMGKGIAMPGMVNPNFQQKIDTEENLSSNKEVKIQSVKKGIAKGPRGKKLPKSLKNPVNVEVTPRFSSFVLTLWELDFQSNNKLSKEDSIVNNHAESENKENKQEVLKSIYTSEDFMDSETLSSSICPAKPEEELNPNHDTNQEIPKTAPNECEGETLEDVDNIEDSVGVADEKISEEVQHDETIPYSVKSNELDPVRNMDISENEESEEQR